MAFIEVKKGNEVRERLYHSEIKGKKPVERAKSIRKIH